MYGGIGDRPEKPPRSTTISWMDERPTAREIAVWTLTMNLERAETFAHFKHFLKFYSIFIISESFDKIVFFFF